MNSFLQRGQQRIQADDLPIFIAVFTGNAFTFQRRSGWTKVLLWQTIFNSLPFKGTHINTFHPSGCFERRILCCCPILPPDFAVLLFVPINGVDLDTFPTSIWGTDAVPAFIERVNILRFGQPLSIFVHCAKRQHDVNMRVAVTLVVIEEITDHALIHKLLLAEIADKSEVLLIGQFTRQGKEH